MSGKLNLNFITQNSNFICHQNFLELFPRGLLVYDALRIRDTPPFQFLFNSSHN